MLAETILAKRRYLGARKGCKRSEKDLEVEKELEGDAEVYAEPQRPRRSGTLSSTHRQQSTALLLSPCVSSPFVVQAVRLLGLRGAEVPSARRKRPLQSRGPVARRPPLKQSRCTHTRKYIQVERI